MHYNENACHFYASLFTLKKVGSLEKTLKRQHAAFREKLGVLQTC